MLAITQYCLRTFFPLMKGRLTKLVYFGRRVSIGRNFKTDTIPRILVDKGAKVVIGDNVEFKRNVELRAHKTSAIIISDKVRLDRGIRVLSNNTARVEIGTGARIGLYSVLNGGDSISIGPATLISGFVYLQTSMHGHESKAHTVQEQGYLHAPVVLGPDVWLGTHVVVMPGVTIAQGGVVGSNAVVTKDVAEYQVVAGIPAKTIKERL